MPITSRTDVSGVTLVGERPQDVNELVTPLILLTETNESKVHGPIHGILCPETLVDPNNRPILGVFANFGHLVTTDYGSPGPF